MATLTEFLEQLHREDVSVLQLRVLEYLSRNEGASNSQVADGIGVSRSSISGALERLDRRRMTRREIREDDRRGIVISLTDKGRAVLSLFDGAQ